MVRLLIGNVQVTHRERCTPLMSLDLPDNNEMFLQSFRNVTPDPVAELTFGGLGFLSAIDLTEPNLASSSFDLVMAEKSAPLLSIGQRDVRVRYGNQSAIITVIICPEITGVLLSWLDCIALHILHKDYPLPIQQIRFLTSIKTLQTHLPVFDTSFSCRPHHSALSFCRIGCNRQGGHSRPFSLCLRSILGPTMH